LHKARPDPSPLFAFKYFAIAEPDAAGGYAIASQVLVLLFVLSYFVLVAKSFAATKTLRAQERIFNPQAFEQPQDKVGAKQREYISQLRLFGVPLVHVQFGMPEHTDKPAFGWIADGTKAHGLLVAWGGVAIAPVCVGIISYGVVSIGAVSFGVFSMGTVAIGVIGFGASAIAYKAFASMSSLGWESAFSSGFSIAKEAAIGTYASATHINSEQAAEMIHLSTFGNLYQWALGVLAVLVIVPAIWHSNAVRKRMGKR